MIDQNHIYISGYTFIKLSYLGQVWWYKPLIPEFGRQRESDLSEFKANQGHRVRPCLKPTTKKI